jgi:hypothetical protein
MQCIKIDGYSLSRCSIHYRRSTWTWIWYNGHQNFEINKTASEDGFLKKNAVSWDMGPCRSCVNRCFEGTYRLHFQGRKIRERGTSVSRWLQTVETSVHTRSTRPHIPGDGILHSHFCESLRSYIVFLKLIEWVVFPSIAFFKNILLAYLQSTLTATE